MKKIYGQNAVVAQISTLIYSHLSNKSSQKALSILLCGSTGTGKTHLAYKVSEMLFKLGSHSKFFLHIQSNIHFINQKSLAQNQEQLIQTLKRQIVKSPSSIFVIDEVDKLPKGFLDVMAPFLAHNGNFEGNVIKKCYFSYI